MRVLALALVCGCADEEVTFSDGFGNEEAPGSDALDGTPLGPYLMGSTIPVYARPPGRHQGDGKLEYWSTDTNVLTVASETIHDDVVEGELLAEAPGDARIQLWRKDTQLGSTAVEVRDAAYGDVVWAPGALIGDPDLLFDNALALPNVLFGATATFQLRYTDQQGDEIFGSGVGTVLGGEPAVLVDIVDDYLGVRGDWVTMEPAALGLGIVEVQMNGINLGRMDVTAVDQSAVTGLDLYGSDESQAEAGEILYVAGLARDEDAEPIYGLSAAWEVDGRDSGVVGEVFSYTYDPKADPVTVSISVGGFSSEREIHMGEPVEVSGGCAHAPGRLGWLWLLPALLVSRRR